MDFHGTFFLGPRTARLQQDIPLPRLPRACLQSWHVENVIGDGRCGYRSIARYVGVSWHRVLDRLLTMMLTTDLFPSSHIIEMMSVQDPSSTCPQSCWLNSTRIKLLAASCPDWFASGIYVVKVHEGERALHFCTDGCVESDSHVSSTNACVLGLLTASTPHFVNLRPKPDAGTSKSISQPAAGIQGGAQSHTYVNLEVFHAGATSSDVRFVFAVTIMSGSHTEIPSPVCCLSFFDVTLKGGGTCFLQDGWDKGFCGADSCCWHVLLQLPEQSIMCDFAFAVSGSPFHCCTISPAALQGTSLVKLLQNIVGNVLDASPFTIRIQIALTSISTTEHGASLMPELAVQIACVTTRTDLADELYQAVASSNYENVHSCLAKGQCPNAANSEGFAPLHVALAQCPESPPLIAEALLRARANVNTAYTCGSSPLHVACRQNNHAMVSRLLKANASVNAIDHEGDTPLHTAGVYAEAACVQLLLDWAACLWTRNLQGETPLIAAADCGGSRKTISLLLAAAPPTSWVDVLLMGLYRVMTHLGYSSRQLFVTCRQFSLQQEFYPSAFHGGAFPFQLLGTPPRTLFVTCKRLSLQREFYPLVLFGGATSNNFFLPSMSASASFPTCSLDILQTETPPCLDLLHLPTSVLSHLLGFCFSLATLCPLASSCDSMHHVITSAGTWSGQTLLLRPCACKQLCANQCLRAVCAATPHYGEYAAIAHLNFQLNAPTQRKPALRAWNHCHDSTHGMNFWHTGLNNQAPPVFDVSIFLGTSPCLLHSIPDLHLLIGVFASTSSASLLQLPSPDQALPFNMAAARFHIRHGTCQAIDVASASSFHPADCQHALDFRSRRSFTVVCNQQDQIFSLFDSDGERLLSLSGLRLPKDAPINSFVCLFSPSFSLPSCAVTEDVHRRPRVRATQPHLQKGYSIFHLLPHCTVIGGALLSLESGQHSLPLSLPLLCFCAAVFFHALDYCLLLSGRGGAVELSQHGKPLWCSLHDSSDESDSPAVASPLTTAVPSGAVVSLFDTLDAPDPAPRAEQVAVHQDAFDEQVTRLYADVLDSSSIRASFLQSWRDLFQFEDGDLISRCARLHSENMDWRIFFVNGAYRETPMPLSLAPFLLKGMQCPAVLLWNLGSHALHLLTETETTRWHWHLTLEGFPCIAWNSFTQRYFAIPAAIPAFGDSHMSSAVENSSVSVHVKILEFQTACAKLLATEAFFSSFETTRMECLDAMPKELDLDPSLAHIERCLSPRALRQVCSSRVISLPLGLVLWVFDSNVLLHVSPSTSLRPICLAEGIGLLQLGAALMCCRPSLKMFNRALLQVGQVWFGSVPKSAARATLLLVHLANLHGGFSRSCLFSFVRGGASPLEDMCYLCAVLTCAGDIKTVLTLAKVSTRISSMLRPPNVFPAMRVFISQCNCNRLCFNQCLLSLLPQGFSFHCILSTATVDEIIGGTPFLQNIAHSLDHCQTFWMSRTPTPALFTIKLSFSQLLLRKPALTVFLGLVTSRQPQAIGSSFLWPDHVVPAPHCVVRLTLHQGRCSLLRWQTHRQQSCYEAISPITFHLPQVRLSFVLGPDTARLFGSDGVALSTLQLPNRWPSSFSRTCKAIVCLYCPDHLPLPTVDVATRVEPMFTFVPQALSARGRLHVLQKTLLWGELGNTNPSCDSLAPTSIVAGGFSFLSLYILEQFYQPQSTPTVMLPSAFDVCFSCVSSLASKACNVARAPPISLDCKQKREFILIFISNDAVWINSKFGSGSTCMIVEGCIQNNNYPALLSPKGFLPATVAVLLESISHFFQRFVAATYSLPRSGTQLQSFSVRQLQTAQALLHLDFRAGADDDDEARSLLRSTPNEFNHGFEKLFHSDPDRARLIVRYILADLVPFPVEAVKAQLPEVFRMTDTLAQKAGCPFEWAFLLFLPVLGTACAKARLFINEFFLVPPLLWLGLCLDSGANKSGIMTAMADIVSGFEKILLEAALAVAREEAEAQEAADDAFVEPDESAHKRRKVALSKSLAQIHQNKPALFSDEGSLPAIGMQMSHNGHRAIGLYDEGRFLLRALANGEGSGFNASTMSKLFNGSVWKRTVVKDQNRFAMHQTCLCLAMTFHVEEWHEFLAKDGALGMQSRFLMFHSAPRLEKATKVLDLDVYGPSPSVLHARRMPEPLLNQFVSILRLTDKAHGSTAPDFDKVREFIPYFFAPDALEFFQQHYDAQTLKQEQTYLQDPKQFSHAGKLKSLPWRLSILLHSWTQACRHSFAEENVELPWSRELPRNVVELSRTIFDYLSLQSQLLAPSSDLLAVLDQAGLRESCAQRYPSLLLLLETNTLPRELLPDQVPLSDTFPMWWSGLNPDAKLYSLLTAHWILTSTTTAVVDQGTCVKKIHSKDTGALLPRDTNKAHCQSAFLLLQYTQLAWLVKKPGAAPRLRKRSYPPVGPAAVAFSNLLHEFRQKNAGDRTEYNAQCVTVTDSLKKTCKNELAIPEPSSFETGTMDTALQILHEYIEEANPFQHVAKVLNIRSSGRAPPSQHPELEASGAPALAAGASIAPALFLPASIHMLAAGSSSAQALLHPLSLDMVPSLVLAFHHADPECRDLLAWCLLRQQFPTKQVTERDCNFVFAKLLCQAPHMLADRVVLPTDIPLRSLAPISTSCHFCKCKLRESVTKVVPCISSLDSIQPLAVIFFSCRTCGAKFHGPWVQVASGRKTLLEAAPAFFSVTSNLFFTTAFLQSLTQLLVHCGGSFRGFASCLPVAKSLQARTVETQLRDTWLQFAICQLLGPQSLQIDWSVKQGCMEQWSRSIVSSVTDHFRKRWLLHHQCSTCRRGILGIDGNAKIRTKLCANTDDGIWESPSLKAHCLTGCQNAPIPGRKFCAVHLRDSEPIFGSDDFLRKILLHLISQKALIRGFRVHAHKLACLCRRTRKALLFIRTASFEYPVRLTHVKKVVRTRQYHFATCKDHAFSLLSKDVPIRFQQLYGLSEMQPEARECQSKPRVGHMMQFSEADAQKGCRAQWEKMRQARRSGGLLAAVKECQIIGALQLVYTHESPTGVYFFLADLFSFFAASEGIDLEASSRKVRRRVRKRHMPLVWYDCACTLKRFMTAKKRRSLSKVAKTLSKLPLVIDKFHFKKGHAGCKPCGSRPLPSVWPKSHQPHWGPINDSACEQSFAFLRKLAVAARRMTPVRGLLFVTLVQHNRNLLLEAIQLKRDQQRVLRARRFSRHRQFHEAMEARPFAT